MSTIRATINWTDHHYTTRTFRIVDSLPLEGQEIEEDGYLRHTCAAVRELTDKIARKDFGDDFTIRFYIVYFDDELLVDDEEDGSPFSYWQPDGESFQYFAIRERIQSEDEEAIEL